MAWPMGSISVGGMTFACPLYWTCDLCTHGFPHVVGSYIGLGFGSVAVGAKLPVRCARVGTDASELVEEMLRTFSKSAKKKVRFLMIGPPMEKPPWSRFASGLGLGAGLKKSRASICGRCK